MSSVKSADGAFVGMGGADSGCWPAGILICAVSPSSTPRPSAIAADVIPASCPNRLRVSIEATPYAKWITSNPEIQNENGGWCADFHHGKLSDVQVGAELWD